MKKLFYLIILGAGIMGCSTDSLETETLESYDANVNAQEADKSMSFLEEEICYGDSPVFVFDFPQNSNGPHDADTDIKIQIETYPGSGEWESFIDLSYSGAGPEEFVYEEEIFEEGTYSFRAKIARKGWDYRATFNVVDCTECEESFSYGDNEDGTYTFTYIPEEDMEDAEVVFTFAQSVVVSGYDWDWNGKSSSRTEMMNFSACETYSWTIAMEGDCSGNSAESNLWTDFKVNDVSKKNDNTPNIEQDCE